MSSSMTVAVRSRGVWASTLVAILVLLALPSAVLAQIQRPARDLVVAADVMAAIRDARLAELLVPTAPTTAAEDRALIRAIDAYQRRSNPEDVGSLVAFVDEHPRSGWAPAILTNLGLSYLHYGHFSLALEAWQKAWTLGKDAKGLQARALVDGALGGLARLYAAFGQTENLARLLEEIGDRAVTGSATEAIQRGHEMLNLVKKDPRHLFICGPTALRALMLKRGAEPQQVDFLRFYRAGPNGTSFAEVAQLADKVKLSHRLIFRKPGQRVPIPSIVHWKVGHFATIVGEANGRFEIEDPVFAGRSLWVTRAALDAEASGYFLIGADAADESAWRTVEADEAGRIWGKGPTAGTDPNDPDDPPATAEDNPEPGDTSSEEQASGEGKKPCPLCRSNIKEASVSVTLSDTPVGYTPPVGPSVKIRITYNQREESQPQGFNFFNVSPKWTLNWLGYVTDDPANIGANVSRYMPGGGARTYSGYNGTTNRFAAQPNDGSILVLVSQSPITYRRQKRDGSVEVYAQSDGSVGFPRRVFLSQVIDPRGNAVTLNYDGQQRLISLTDAGGRQTTFSYTAPGRPLLVTRITDPFGRAASLTYDDDTGRLTSITDIIGLTSSFAYDTNYLVNALTTPYGTTTFAYTAPGTSAPPRFVQVTDPMGFSEREEWLEPAPVSSVDSPTNLPQGMPVTLTNNYLEYRNSFYWSKAAYVEAGCTPSGGCDYTKARIRHFTHLGATNIKATVLESVKYPFENRVWNAYLGQTTSYNSGTFNQPIAVGRVLDDGSTQLTQFTYDTANYFNVTSVVDPVGRRTLYTYANGIDLLAVTQITEGGFATVVGQYTYNYRHRPLSYVDAAGQTTRYDYNTAGQLTAVTNPLNQTTSYQYDGSGRLSTVTNANSAVVATYTYDAFNRVATFTDSEGWVAAYSYDAADRLTKTSYPDGTNELRTYDKLDLATYTDRLGRIWTYTRDANRRVTKVRDPVGQETLFGYDHSGRRTSLTDAKGNVTRWTYDAQGRVIAKRYADGSTYTYVYEATTSRLKAVIDPQGQRKQFSYFRDGKPAGITYLNAVNATPSVSFTYDAYFPRLVSTTDGIGTTQYSYVPVGTPGALSTLQEAGPLAGTSIAYAYDALGRVSTRTVVGSGIETVQYDAIGRVTGKTNDMGSFTLSYLGQTGQITQRQLASSTLSTTWTYLNNAGDRRLASIANVGLVSGHFSTYTYTTAPEDILSSITESSDAAAVYPAQAQQTAGYNALNQLTSLQGQPTLTYNANGNLIADGQRTYTWDADDRLIGISYPSQPGKQTAFAYDGLGRRVTISSTPPGGGSATTTSYVWCDTAICQSRDATNAVVRGYSAEGEFLPSSPAQRLFYGPDQLGSVRRVFASTVSAPAYSFDAYGRPLQATTPVTDFGYAGMFLEQDSGLHLTIYRAYDSSVGRWLSRDPVGEAGDPAANLYAYVGANPTSFRDPFGLCRDPDDTDGAGFQKAQFNYAPLPFPVPPNLEALGVTALYMQNGNPAVGWTHIVNRHTVGGINSAGAGIFHPSLTVNGAVFSTFLQFALPIGIATREGTSIVVNTSMTPAMVGWNQTGLSTGTMRTVLMPSTPPMPVGPGFYQVQTSYPTQ